MSKSEFDRDFSTPEPFGDDCQWWAVSQAQYETAEEALDAFKAANNDGFSGMEFDDDEMVLNAVRPAFVRYHDATIDGDDPEGMWHLSLVGSGTFYRVWALDTLHELRIFKD